MTTEEYDAILEDCRTKLNEMAQQLGTPQMGRKAFREFIETPLEDPKLAMIRWEDEQTPSRICSWCFHPRNSPECNFAQKHAPYREMFHQTHESRPAQREAEQGGEVKR